MALLEEILEWSEGLALWQRDALRRLFTNGELTQADLDELLAIVKEQYGGGPAAPRQPDPLTSSHIASLGTGESVQLLEISSLQHVNAFPSGRTIRFNPEGLNVLFGENGAGKSGYARILKNACRARHRSPVLPNAFNNTTPRPNPSAVLTLLVNGNPRRETWTQGGPSDANLSMVAVYDNACGADYIEKEGATEYQPFGLSQLNRLAQAQHEMQQRVEREKANFSRSDVIIDRLRGDHPVGRHMLALGPDTDLDALCHLATLREEDTSRLAELRQALNTMNPEPAAQDAERLADRLGIAVVAAANAQRFVSDAALAEVRTRFQAEAAARDTQELAQRELTGADQPRAEELLPGTGNDVWKLLFRAAAKFSTEYAYPTKAHPHIENGAKCVLCQTTLDPDAQARMRRFADYVANEASRRATETRDRMNQTMEAIRTANLEPFDGPTLAEIRAKDPALETHINEAIGCWGARRRWIQTAVHQDVWDSPAPEMPAGDVLDVRIRTKATALRAHARELRQSQDPEARARLEAEQSALLAREELAAQWLAVEKWVFDSRTYRNLLQCYRELNPFAVSNKMTQLAKTHITTALADGMNAELESLGFRRRVQPEIVSRTSIGTTMVTLKIKGSVEGTHEVLSEGEQRAMALALFLAEARLQGHTSTIIFDDPSTSLDHRHRRAIAIRLAGLAQERQVLVMTHDAIFLTEINDAVKKSGQPVKYQTIGWDRQPGCVSDGLTWETMDCSARLEAIKELAKDVRANSSAYLNEAGKERIADGYTRLRGTIERAVREVFLNNTIQPFSDVVSVDSFGAVIGHPEDEWSAVSDIYGRCCEVTFAHDTSAEHQVPIPEPDQLTKDIDAMIDLIAKARKRKAEYESKRSKRNKERKAQFSS